MSEFLLFLVEYVAEKETFRKHPAPLMPPLPELMVSNFFHLDFDKIFSKISIKFFYLNLLKEKV
jgi:hypothetical protein